jgi:PAS domain S-box-containing protein
MLRSIPDYETRGPLPYPDTATRTVIVSVVLGAVLALVLHSAFGIAPPWVPLLILVVLLGALFLRKKLRLDTDSSNSAVVESSGLGASTTNGDTDQNHVALRDKERLALALEAGSLGIWDWHIPSGRVQFGGCWASMLGYANDEIEPNVSSWERLVHPDDMPVVQAVLKKHLTGESPEYLCEHRLRKKDGTWLWVLDRGRVVNRDSKGAPIRAIGIHADVSEAHAIREEQKATAKRKDEFLATLAHELRNPLAPIRTGLQILKTAPSGPAADKARDMMERQLSHMVHLIDDLLDVSRITRGTLELKMQDILLQGIIDTAVEGSRPAIDAGKHSLSITLPDQPLVLHGDPTRLAQIVSNILINAAKYTPSGGKISISAIRENNEVVITVSDTGVGIPTDKLDAIFEMFGQVNQSIGRAQGGLGIGLALVKNLVSLHGGTVHAESAGANRGSTFVIRLPLATDTSATGTSGAPVRMQQPESTPSEEILVVDDNIDGAESLALYLHMTGHSVSIANTGAEALEAVRTKIPRVIFLDIGLPDMSGYEVAKNIRGMPHGTEPFIAAVTGWGSEEDKRKSRDAGCSAHLTKPIDMAEVDRIVGGQTL